MYEWKWSQPLFTRILIAYSKAKQLCLYTLHMYVVRFYQNIHIHVNLNFWHFIRFFISNNGSKILSAVATLAVLLLFRRVRNISEFLSNVNSSVSHSFYHLDFHSFVEHSSSSIGSNGSITHYNTPFQNIKWW